ncbi:hypothetical protein CMUS01_09974 [Colletotrichum musicola]|uniref:Uncharacterized protein n=1 Tax=Colletotrichum musicola TaxID=2175873 RepID=A0A8H6NA62_9PEZI|nr:hypothetical protein CMUS01_09974 [Colletotrichum musicola]
MTAASQQIFPIGVLGVFESWMHTAFVPMKAMVSQSIGIFLGSSLIIGQTPTATPVTIQTPHRWRYPWLRPPPYMHEAARSWLARLRGTWTMTVADA